MTAAEGQGHRLAREFLDRVEAPHGSGMHAVIVMGGEDGHGPFTILACCDDQAGALLRDGARVAGRLEEAADG